MLNRNIFVTACVTLATFQFPKNVRAVTVTNKHLGKKK